MKRYLLFGGDDYYPAGGWNDYCGDGDTPEEALKLAFRASRLDLEEVGPQPRFDWWHVVDAQTGEVQEFTYKKWKRAQGIDQ